MLKNALKTLMLIMVLGVAFPGLAQDSERINRVQQEIESRELKQYLQSFENYFNFLGPDGQTDDLMAANTVVRSLKGLTNKYPTVNAMYDLLTELLDSGYYTENNPMLLTNFHSALEAVRGYGFGSGKLGSWQFKHMTGACGKQENVYVSTIAHPSKPYTFGFWLSEGTGFVDQATLKGKDLKMGCH